MAQFAGKRTVKHRILRHLRWVIAFVGVTSLSFTFTFYAVFLKKADYVRHVKMAIADAKDDVTDSYRRNPTWIILDTTNDTTTSSIKHNYLSLIGKNVIVIGKKGIERCSQTRLCHDLRKFHVQQRDSIDAVVQTILRDGIISSVDHYTASVYKMAAVLLAVRSQAQWIYIGQAESLSLDKIAHLMAPGRRTGLVYSKSGYFNLLRTHFGHPHPDLTPRAEKYYLKRVHPHGLTAFLNRCTTQRLCAASNPPIYFRPGTLASVPPSLSFLSHRTSFWMLLLSMYPDNHASRHLMGSFLQRLMWETEFSFAISPSEQIDQYYNKEGSICSQHNCISRIMQKSLNSTSICPPLKKSADRAKDYNLRLLTLKCTWTDSPFTKCGQELMTSFLGYRKDDDELQVISGWFQLLHNMEYRFPDRDPLTDLKLTAGQQGVPIWFTPSPCRPKARMIERKEENGNGWINSDGKTPDEKLLLHPARLVEECKFANVSIDPAISDHFKIPDILLVIVFNFPYLASHIPLLLTMYGRHFRHILFCGENFPSFIKFYRMNRYPHVSFVEINHAQGTWGYSCMSAAIKMNYDVRGYLQMSDDVLLNVWSLKNVPRDKFWYQSRVRVADIRLTRLPDIATTNRWYPWIFAVGRYAATVAFRSLKQLLKYNKYREKVENFLSQLHQTTQCATCLVYEASDIFYVPEAFQQDFALFSDIFQASQLHLEIAIPSAIFGLSAESDVFRLRGNYVWGDDRADFKKYYSAFDHFQHAWKLTRLANREGVEFFCQSYLPWLERDLLDDSQVDS